MSEITHYRRITYEDLILIWLDRINQTLQFESFDTNTYNMEVERAVRTIRTLYFQLPYHLRREIDKHLGKPLPEYLDTRPYIHKEIYGIYPADLKNEFFNEINECTKRKYEEEKTQCYTITTRKYSDITLERVETTLAAITDTLHATQTEKQHKKPEEPPQHQYKEKPHYKPKQQ